MNGPLNNTSGSADNLVRWCTHFLPRTIACNPEQDGLRDDERGCFAEGWEETADTIVRAPRAGRHDFTPDTIVRAPGLWFACVVAILLSLAWTASAATELRIGHAFATPGDTVLVPIRGSSAASVVAAQFDFDFTPGGTNISDGDALLGPLLTSHELTSGRPETGVRRVVIHSPSNAPLSNGTWVLVPLTLSSNAPLGTIPLLLTNVVLATDSAAALTNFVVLAGSLTVTSSIPQAPVIVRAPTNQDVLAGSGMVLEVSVLGRTPLSYQWQRNGTNLPGATADALVLNPIRTHDAGEYRVVVSNQTVSVTSDAAVVSVGLPPLQLVSAGGGALSFSPADYAMGDTVQLSATPKRWFEFARWSDGNASNPRAVSIGAFNRYTAIFTNTVPLESFAEREWDAAFGGTEEERACDGMVATPDGGFLVLATSSSRVSGNKTTPGFGGQDLWLLKLDASGRKQWERVYGGSQDDQAVGLLGLPNGGYVLGGRSRSGADGNKSAVPFGAADFWLIGIDAQGQVLWQRSYGTAWEDTLTALRSSADGGFFALGNSVSAENGNKTSPNYGHLDIWVLKLDAAGNKVWDTGLGGAEDDQVFGAAEATDDGGLLVSGASESGVFGSKDVAGYGDADYWTVRLGSTGQILWQRDDGGNVDDAPFTLARTVDGGSMVAGYSLGGHDGNRTSPSEGGADGWLVKLDGAGGKQWEQNYGGTSYDAFTGTVATWDNGAILAGSSDSEANGSKWADTFGDLDVWLMKVDARGERLWESNFGGSGRDELGGICAMAGGGLLVSATSSSGDNGNKLSPALGGNDLWLVKLSTWDLPVGMPRIYVDGRPFLGGTAEFSRTNEIEVAIVSSFEGAQIFYTLDGSPPDAGSEPYSQTLQISPQLQPVVIRALAFDQFYGESWEADPVTIVVHGYGVATSVEGAGSIQLSPEPPVVKFTEVEARAVPAAGWAFDHWSGALTGAEPVQRLSVEGDMTLKAHFIPTYPLTVTAQGQGTIVLDPSTGPYRSNAVVTLTAQAAPGWVFRNWSGDVSSTAASTTVTMLAPRVARAIFVRQFAVGAGTPGGGMVSVDPPQALLGDGTRVTLTATPQPGWTFLRWQGDVIGNANPMTVTVQRDLAIQGIFGTGLSTVTNPAGFGSILREPSAGPYAYGSIVQLSAVPLAGKFLSVWGGAAAGLSNNPLSLRITNANPSATAVFGTLVTNRFSLTTLVSGQGTVGKSPPQSWYSNGVSVVVTAVAAPDRVFLGWSGDATGTNNPLTVVMTTNKTVTAMFNGTLPVIVTAPRSQTVDAGSDVTFTALASGTAPLAYQWYRNGVAILSATEPALLLRHVSDADEGQYSVAVSNSAGTAISTPAAILSVSQEYTFITLAGLAGSAGSADGMGDAARFYNPSGISVDAGGILYVGDSVNHTIRKITAAGGVTTLAGSAGSPGSTDGSGMAARFNSPFGAAVDRAGNLYVGDTMNHTLRKVSPSGEVTTLAGSPGVTGSADGTGSAARFDWPFDVALDREDNLYVVDAHNQTIRKVTQAGVVTTLAGLAGVAGSADGVGPAARFNGPVGIAVDGTGTIYVADSYNHTIRRVSPAGEVTTLAGGAGISGSADGVGGIARFHYPYTLTLDSVGNLYVADHYNNAIRKVTQAGEVTTVAGVAGLTGSSDGTGNAARFNHPAGIAMDDQGNLYVTDLHNLTIRKGVRACPDRPVIDQAQGLVGASRQLDAAPQTAVIWEWSVTQRPPGSTAQIPNATTRNPVFRPDIAGLYTFQLRATDAAGNIAIRTVGFTAIGPFTDYTFTTLAGSTGNAGISDGMGSDARFNYPYGVAVDKAGTVYVADQWSHAIRKVTAAGDVTTLAGLGGTSGSTDGLGTGARFSQPIGVAVNTSGDIVVADYANQTIRTVGQAGAVSTLAGLAGSIGSADGPGNAARFNYPCAVVFTTDNAILAADYHNHTIRRVSASGEVTTLAGLAGSSGNLDGIGNAARFNNPSGVGVDDTGCVYVADINNHTIRKVTPSGNTTTLAGLAGSSGSLDGIASTARFDSPLGVTVDGAGNVYVVDATSHTVRKVSPAGVVTTIGGLAGSPGSVDGPGDMARFNTPTGIAVDSMGNLYVADEANHTIRKGVPLRSGRPLISSQPADRAVEYVPIVVFEVVASGDSLTYEWRHDGVKVVDDDHVSGASGPRLVVNPAGPADAGSYVCVISNPAGIASSHVAQLVVPPPQLPAPSRLRAGDGEFTNRVELTWNVVTNATGYLVYRNASNDVATMSRIGDTPTNSFADTGIASGQPCFYWVQATNASMGGFLSAADLGYRQGPGLPLTPAGMSFVPGGPFRMGESYPVEKVFDPVDRWGLEPSYPPHTVSVGAFFIARGEVTKGLWDDVYAWGLQHGYAFDNAGTGRAADQPVVLVSWYDCVKWCNALSEMEGLTPVYYTDLAHTQVYRTGQSDLTAAHRKLDAADPGYRLPSEAEWEKAARGGLTGHMFSWRSLGGYWWEHYASGFDNTWNTSDPYGEYPRNPANPQTTPSGYLNGDQVPAAPDMANGFGLYDVGGNVRESCWDWYERNWYSQPAASEDDPLGPAAATGSRVCRGGSWWDNPTGSLLSVRAAAESPTFVYADRGFRVARSLKPETQPPVTPTAWNKILLTRVGGGGSGIYAMNPDGSDVQPLTFSAGDWGSTGGNGKAMYCTANRRIYFWSNRDGMADWSNLYSMNVDGSDLTPLTTDDYRHGYFCVDGAAATIYYLFNNGGVRRTDVMDLDGGNKRTPVWADGKTPYDVNGSGQLLVDDGGILKRINADGSDERVLRTSGFGNPTWSPDGRTILFVDGWRLWKMDADGANAVQIDLGTLDVSYAYPRFTPDGQKLLFAATTKLDSYPFDIYLANPDGTGVQNLTQTPTLDESTPFAYQSGSTKPQILVHPSSTDATLGADATFKVQATGELPLSYEWSKDGFILSDGGRLTGATSPELTISGVQLSDAGHYSVIVANALGSATSHVAQLTVSQVNHVPMADARIVATTEDVAVAFAVTGTDQDLDPLTFEVVTVPASGTLTGIPPNLTFTPATNMNGQVQFTFRVNDGRTHSLPATVTITVAPVNDAPVLGFLNNRAVSEGSTLSFNAVASDPDLPAQALTFSLPPEAPAGANISAGGAFTWTPTEAQGPSTNLITVNVSDGMTNAQATFTAVVNEVNQAPAFGALPDRTIGSGGSLRFILPGTDPDLPANRLTYGLVSGPAGLTVDATTGELAWTPGGTFGGTTNAVTVRVTDNGVPPLGTNGTFRIAVVANAAPVIDALADRSLDEGIQWSMVVGANDPDGPRELLQFSLEPGAPAGMTIDAVSGEIRWTPDETQGPSTNLVFVRVTDQGTPPSSGTGAVRLIVNEVNAAPSLDAVQLQHTDPSKTLGVALHGHDADLPANSLRYELVSGPPGATVDPVTGLFTWLPNAAAAGAIVPVIVRVVDNGSPAMQALQSFAIQVSGCPPGGMRILVDDICYGPETHVTVTNGASLRIEPAFERSLVFYTLDGQIPDESAAEFAGTLTISTNVIVRARALDLDSGDMQESGPVFVTVEHAYTILARTSGGGAVLMNPAWNPATNSLGARYGPYPGGMALELSAQAAPGWSFLNWERAAAPGGTQSVWPLVLQADAEVEAAFGTRIVLTNISNGIIHLDPAADLYRYGTRVRVTAEPAAGYYHRFWQGSGLPTTPVPLELTMTNAEPRISAIFSRLAANQVTLTVLSDGPGSVLVDPVQNVYTNDQVVCVTANTVSPANPFLGWTGLTNSGASQVCVKLSGSQTNFVLTAHFNTNALPFWFSPPSYAVRESNILAQLTVQRGLTGGASVGFRTVPGTALPLDADGWGDYAATNGLLTFDAGAAEATLSVSLRDNHSFQSNRVFNVELFDMASTNVVFASAPVTLVEDDPPPSDCSVLVRKVEGGGTTNATLRVTLEPGAPGQKWRLGYEHVWRNSGDSVSLVAGDYDLRFKPAVGYEPPDWSTNGLALHTVRVNAGLNQVTHPYGAIAAAELPNGIDVLIYPAEVRTQARWRMMGDTLWLSGERTNVAIGEHLIEFSPVEGYVAPLAQTVVVGPSGVQAIAVEYTQAPPEKIAAHQTVELASADISRFPYRFAGQIVGRKDSYGSGTAVREKVVLTAAHVVYDTKALANRSGVRWLHMGQGTGRDASLQPRGWVLWSSYSEQAATYLTYTNQIAQEPVRGLASLRTRDMDVATLYFLTPAARGWYSGYLVSGPTACGTNQWLESTLPKVLVGFPNTGQNFGRMMELGPASQPMSRMTNADYVSSRVFGADAWSSFGGNSGAALCVDSGNGVFYPAGIYLGVTDGKGMYAAIDSLAVGAIIRQADYLADTGRSHDGSGGPIEAPLEQLGGLGGLTVKLDPPAAVAAGARWFLTGLGGPYTNSQTVPFLQPGTYEVTFGAVAGFQLPARQTVSIWPDQTAPVQVTYHSATPSSAGVGSWVLNSGRLELAITGSIGSTWVLEASTNLADPVRFGFRPIKTNALDGTGRWLITDTNVPNRPERYFRLSSP